MTNNEILNVRHLPKTNRQIQRASPAKIALAIAYNFLFENIESKERDFDNLWENGRTTETVKEFTKLWKANDDLKQACVRSNYFSISMIGG